MEFAEKDLEDIIWENSQTKDGREKLFNRGLDIRGKLLRQVNIGGYGIADLISIELNRGRWGDEIIVTIYELKKDQINIDTLIQAFRYLTGVQRFIDSRYEDYIGCLDIRIDVVLIGKAIESKSDFVFLLNKCVDDCNLYLYTYKYDIDGLCFEDVGNGWYKTNEKFDSIDFNFAESSVRDKKEMLGILNKKQ